MVWWAWIILGFFLVLAELVTPGGFYLIFFGIGALVVGVLRVLGIAGPGWVQWLLFSLISAGLLASLRKSLVDRFSAKGDGSTRARVDTDTVVGETAVAAEKIPCGEIGRVEMRGSAWRARNRGAQELATGQRCTVERVEGLLLDVRPQ